MLLDSDDFRREVLYSKEVDQVLHRHAKPLQVGREGRTASSSSAGPTLGAGGKLEASSFS